jgi:DNA (cytosine-5)-methyltransferase 1
MGIDWMNRDELSQAIPPVYTELIGFQLRQHIDAEARKNTMQRGGVR